MKIKSKGNFYMQARFNITEWKSDDDKIIIEWYASTKDLDRWNDIVEPTAFDSSIKSFLKNNPQMLYQHDDEKSIGKFTKWTIDKKGLFVKWEVLHNIDVNWIGIFDMIRKGTLTTFSIWFKPIAYEFKLDWKVLATQDWLMPWCSWDDLYDKDVIRVIKDLELVEISIVTVPMNWNATFAVQKSLQLNKQEIMKNLKEFVSFNKESQEEEERMIERLSEWEKEEQEKEEIIENQEKDEEKEKETPEKVENEVEKEEEEEEPSWDGEENSKEEDEKDETIETSSENENDEEIDPKTDEKVEEEEKNEVDDEKDENTEKEEEENDQENVDEEKEEEKNVEDEEKSYNIELEKIVEKIIKRYVGEWKEEWDENSQTDENSDDDTPKVEKSLYDKLLKEKKQLEEQIERLSQPVNKWQIYWQKNVETDVKKVDTFESFYTKN